MSDDKPGASRPDDETQPVRHEGDGTLPPPPAAAATDGTPTSDAGAAPGRRGFRERLRTWRRSEGDRTFGLAALIASALAGIIVGGLGLATFQRREPTTATVTVTGAA